MSSWMINKLVFIIVMLRSECKFIMGRL